MLKEAEGYKSEIQLQQEALMRDNKAYLDNEKKLKEEHERKMEEQKKEVEPSGGKLAFALGGTLDERLTEVKSIYIEMKDRGKPEIVFTGFWNGKLVKVAQNSLSKAYRSRRFKKVRTNAQGGSGDEPLEQ